MRLPPAVVAFAALLVLAGSASAQNADNEIDALTPGRRALSFNLPNGGGAGLGVWKIVASDRARGFFVNFSGGYDHSEASQSDNSASSYHVSASVGPQVRRYLGRLAPVAPFLQSGLSLGASYVHQSNTLPPIGSQPPETASSAGWSGTLGVSAGPGVEWFPLRRVSLAGQTGLNLSGSYGRSTNEAPGVDASYSSWSIHFGTFVSSLMLQIYF